MSVYRVQSGNLHWRAVVSRKDQPRLIKHFPTRAEANMWEEEQKRAERLKDVPEYRQARELKQLAQFVVHDLVDDYIKHNASSLHPNNIITLNQFKRDPLASKSLLDVSEQDGHRFSERKKKETWKPPNTNGEPKQLSPRTVRRAINIIQRVFVWCQKNKEGCAGLINPFKTVTVEGSTGGRRQRALQGNELERILESCKSCHVPNNYFIPLAVFIAIDTGMRRQEIFNLWWSDIDDENRRIRIRKSKTDKLTGNVGGTIVLPARAKVLLLTLAAVLFEPSPRDGEWQFPQFDERIFPMTEKAFSQAWSDILRRAGINDLHFHDLRREANWGFYKAGLAVDERNLMLRHADGKKNEMDSVYLPLHERLNVIQDKLDRHLLMGMTLDEAMEKRGGVDFGKLLGADMVLPVVKARAGK
jgi:integrase